VKARLGVASPDSAQSVSRRRVTEVASVSSTADQREKELEKARLMQGRFFPETFPLGRGLSFAGRHRASHRIGGDLFDVQKCGEERLAFMIADVSGHGVAAALLTGMVKVLFQNSVQQCEDPGLLLGMMNEELMTYCGGGEYLTMFVGIWDPNSQTLLYSGAGHPPAYAMSADGARVARLEGRGGVLGVTADAHFKTMDIRLKPKQRLVLYTDGLTEQSSPRQELFGEKQLVEVCTRWATLPLDAVVEVIYAEVDKFSSGEPQADDQALLLVEVDPR
jgi:serine phosphatase RsbU (regulator of sigma subunit)